MRSYGRRLDRLEQRLAPALCTCGPVPVVEVLAGDPEPAPPPPCPACQARGVRPGGPVRVRQIVAVLPRDHDRAGAGEDTP